MSVINKIIANAQASPKRIVLPEGGDDRVLAAAIRAQTDGLADITVIGNVESIRNRMDQDINFSVVDCSLQSNREKYLDNLVQLRAHKGMTPEKAQIELGNPLVFADMMLNSEHADGCVAGAANTTGDVLRAALQLVGMHPDSELVSSFFLMDHKLPHQAIQGTVLYADCAMVPEPTAEQLAAITLDTVKNGVALLNMEPKVALLSFSTAGSAKHPLVDKVVTAGEIISSKQPELELMPEVQFDAAIMPEILSSKAPDIKVEAPANIFVFPDLQSANIGYKIAQRIGGVDAIGPILQGLKLPVNDLSRGCSADDIYNLIAVTCVQAQN